MNKILLLLMVFAGAALAQPPGPCSSISNSATKGQVLGANGSGKTPPCKWVPGGSGGGPATPTNSLQKNNGAGAFAASSVVDNGTTVSTTEPISALSISTGASAPTCTTGTGGASCLHEGTAVTGQSGADNCYGDSTVHNILCSFNNGALVPLSATTTFTTGTSATLSTSFTVNQEATAGAGVAYTLPPSIAGPSVLQFCIDNGWNGSAADTGVLTLNTSGSGQFIIYTDGTLTASGGNLTSGGAARDGGCVASVDATHWMWYPHSGTWTKH